jgi:hypothetical protein
MDTLIEPPRPTDSVEDRLAELLGDAVDIAFEPQRPIESNVSTMEPTLTKLPSFRMIAGWFVLIVGLVLAFIFMHRP